MEQITMWGYTFLENGHIIGVYGKELKHNNRIKVNIDGKLHTLSTARVIYYAFHQDEFDLFDRNKVVSLKNKDKGFRIENLKLLDKLENLRGENNVHCKLTDKEVSEILWAYNKAKQKDKGLNKNNPNKRLSMRSLASKYNVSHNLISLIVNNKYRKKED